MRRPLILIIAEPGDLGAAAVASATASRAREYQVEVLNPVELSLARWSHTLSRSGRAASTVTVPSGRQIVDEQLGAVLMRSDTTPVPRFARSSVRDRDYAAAELRALIASWLRSLGSRVVNRTDGVSLVGPSWTPRRWVLEAQRAGLPVTPYLLASSARLVSGWQGHPHQGRLPLETATGASAANGARTLVIAGDRVEGAEIDPHQHAACLGLAARAGCRLAELHCGAGPASIGVIAARAGATLAAPGGVDAAAVGAVADLLVTIARDSAT